MRVTNNMILRNSTYNINGTKTTVNSSMNQMTTQKKITKPSDDPVVAIRSLRLSTSLSRVEQYYKKNIPDAQSWLDVTETALNNMKSLMTDIRTQCVTGSTDTLTQDDRNTILSQLKALQSQVFAEGNADYAGRTVFTGYRTDQDLVFTQNETDCSYDIEQKFTYEDMESFRYYTGVVEVPTTGAEVLNDGNIADLSQSSFYRIRLSYDKIADVQGISYSYGTTQKTLDASNMDIYETEADWAAALGSKTVNDDRAVFIKSTGELIFGDNIASEIRTNKAELTIDYERTGFEKGELRPEYYYNCTDKTNPLSPVTYEKFDANGEEIGYDINYTVSANQELTVNLEASDAFDSAIQRDVDDMIQAVENAIAAHEKVDNIKSMMTEAQYAGDNYQESLKKWLTAAQKEADYADDHLQKLYSSEIGKMDDYLENINLAITKVGCTVDQLQLTETRMSNQQETIMELQSSNDDLDISEIIMNYTSAYNAYQSSLTAAGKLSGMTLLNYI